MIQIAARTSVLGLLVALSAGVSASELSYSYMDFQYVTGKAVDAMGQQTPVPGQTVDVDADEGDGIAVSGAVTLGQRFYVGGGYQNTIVDLFGVVTSPTEVNNVQDEFDLVQTRISVGYIQPVGENFDFVFEASVDSTDYDFGSFAGENFDFQDTGAGAQIGFRWNPTLRYELYSFARYSQVGEIDLTRREFEPDTLFRLGMIWYFFEDLGLGVDFESGQLDTVTLSMRFSFGDLALRR